MKKLPKFKLSDFSQNVVTLISGTGIAQLLPIAVSPFLTRIYNPDEFGVFAVFISFVMIFSTVTTGRYELAIVLPKLDKNALMILIISITLTVVLNSLIFLLIIFFGEDIVRVLDKKEALFWLYLVPVMVILLTIHQSYYYWYNRKKKYKDLAKNKVLQSGVTVLINIVLGLLAFGSLGLIFGRILGQAVSSFSLFRSTYHDLKNITPDVSKARIYLLAKKFVNFPKLLVFSRTMNTISSQIPLILFSALFNSTFAGYFMLTQRVVQAPMSIVSNAIGDVFRQSANAYYIDHGQCREIYFSTLRKLIKLSFGPFFIFFLYSPELFLYIFGVEWEIAGKYAQALTPMFFLQFISNPLSNMFLISEKQFQDLWWNICLLFTVLLSIYFGAFVFRDSYLTVILFSSGYSLLYIINLLLSYKFSKGF